MNATHNYTLQSLFVSSTGCTFCKHKLETFAIYGRIFVLMTVDDNAAESVVFGLAGEVASGDGTVTFDSLKIVILNVEDLEIGLQVLVG